ncbi:MAG: HslU--HslV peptidase ATPase subunit, partial [Chloroflexi bacterium]
MAPRPLLVKGTDPVSHLTPPQIVEQLDHYIVGQVEAKRALALCLRERERRKRLDPEFRAEVGSKNVMVIGPTGVGKTELARRLARMVEAPFIKTEATKFTEVGYVGRDVESIVRELADASVSMVHQERLTEVRDEAERLATERILTYLIEGGPAAVAESEGPSTTNERAYMKRKRRAMARRLAEHELDERVIEIEIETDEPYSSVVEFASGIGPEEIHEQFQEFMSQVSATKKRSRRVSVREAQRILGEQEASKLIDLEDVVETALRRVEESGMVFLDEIDKLVSRGADYGPDVSGEGVQRDL